jgi:asparagine synthase (glutamine-hydrolysing)
VQHRLEADVPVGCYLSGGIDSCSMLGLASAVQQSPVKAFTISFDHDAYDEAAIAQEMAARTRADQELLKLRAGDLYGDNYVTTLWHAERTFYNTLGVAKWCMSRRVHDCGYKVVVTGEGADELFGGYPALKRDMFLHGPDPDGNNHELLRAMEQSNRIFRGAILAESDVSHPALERRCGFTPSWIQPWLQTLALARPLMHDDLQAATRDYDPVEAIADALDPDALAGRHPLDVAQYTWTKTMLECQILSWGGDRVDMANAMESRPAFLDHNVAAAAAAVPPELRVHRGVEKFVLREAMKQLLPAVLYERQKFAFMAPPGHTSQTKRAAVQALLGEYVSPERVRSAGIFDPGRLRSFLDGWAADTDPVSLTRKDALLNHVIGLQLLHHQFVEQNAAPAPARAAAEHLLVPAPG